MRKSFITRFLVSKIGPVLARYPGVFLVLGLVYFILPVDIFPEALAGPLGYLDDLLAFVLAATLFKKFQGAQPSPPSRGGSAKPAQTPHEILGLKPGASKEEITLAYRKRMSEYHPDKVAHLGEDLKKTAHEKSLQIQEAYQQLTKD